MGEYLFGTGRSIHVSDSIPLSMPDITDDEVHDVAETLRSGELTAGPHVDRFEWMVARRCARNRAVAVNAGTSGILLSLMALGIKPGDEIMVPALGSTAANSVELLGATPVFIDCDPRTLNLPCDAVERRVTDKTRAIIAANTFGNPAGMNQIAALSTKLEIPLIEDAGEGLGGHHQGDPVGRFGRVAVFSFGRNGIITTGEGGMIVTHEDRLADRCLALRNEGRPELTRDHEKGVEDIPLPEEPGLICRMSELSAALGAAQMVRMNEMLDERQRVAESYTRRLSAHANLILPMSELSAALGAAQMVRMNEMLDERQRVAESYTRRLSAHADLILPTMQPETVLSWPRFIVRLTDRFTEDDRDSIIAGMRRHDVGAAAPDPPMPLMPHFRQKYGAKPGDFPAAESVSQRSIMLPMFTRLTEREIDLISQTLELMITRQSFARN